MSRTKQFYKQIVHSSSTCGRKFRVALALIALLHPSTGFSQTDQQPLVNVTISGVEDALLNNVRGFLPLYRFNGEPAPSPGRLRFLHAQSEEKIREALTPFGFYRPTVNASLELVDDIWQATYDIETGEPILIGSVDIKIFGQAENDTAFVDVINSSPIKANTPLLHEDYESLKQRFQVLASQRGYFDAKLSQSKIRIDIQRYVADVVLHFDSGQRYYLGEVIFNQNTPWLSEDMLKRYSEIKPGQPYLADDLQQLQGDLSNTEYYSEVTLDVSPQNASETREIPVIVNLTARNPNRYTFGAGYGTDTGARVKAAITRRRINQAGHHFTGELLLSEFRYGIAGNYIIPAADPRTDAWGIRGSLQDEHSETQDFTSASLGGYYRHRDDLWIKTYSVDYLSERFEVSGGDETSQLLIPSIEWTRTNPSAMGERISPSHGTLLQLSIRGASEDLLSDTSFIQPMVSGKWIYSFANANRVIARGAAGTTYVSDFDKLPSSLRFFSGGDKTVRGHVYNVIGPTVEGQVVGGKNLVEASLEYEVPIREKWSLAAFVDTGDAYDGDDPDLKSGIGLGVRWRSPIGPVRLDFAHALDTPPGSDLRLHLTIGSDL